MLNMQQNFETDIQMIISTYKKKITTMYEIESTTREFFH